MALDVASDIISVERHLERNIICNILHFHTKVLLSDVSEYLCQIPSGIINYRTCTRMPYSTGKFLW